MLDNRNHKLFWGSSYDRGLEHLLKMWPQIRSQFPDATLEICYGWNLFDAGFKDNPERMAWKERISKMMNQEGITHHGRVSKKKLAEIRKQCGIWAYPTHFGEINCITALECQHDGVVPCVIDYAALKETVQSGAKVEGDIYEPETQAKYLAALLNLMENKEVWEKEQKKAVAFAKTYSWDVISKEWEKYF